jgi:hypothetical protein
VLESAAYQCGKWVALLDFVISPLMDLKRKGKCDTEIGTGKVVGEYGYPVTVQHLLAMVTVDPKIRNRYVSAANKSDLFTQSSRRTTRQTVRVSAMFKWRCYVCGEPINGTFALFSLSEETDRVFLSCGRQRCLERMRDNPFIVKVLTAENKA